MTTTPGYTVDALLQAIEEFGWPTGVLARAAELTAQSVERTPGPCNETGCPYCTGPMIESAERASPAKDVDAMLLASEAIFQPLASQMRPQSSRTGSVPSREEVEDCARCAKDTFRWQLGHDMLRDLLAEVERLTKVAAYDSELSLERVQRIATLTATVAAQAVDVAELREAVDDLLAEPHCPHVRERARAALAQSASQMDAPLEPSGG